MQEDEPSSIIIDSKVTSGVPILNKKQREEFLRRNLGHDSPSEDEDKASKVTKPTNVRSQTNLQ